MLARVDAAYIVGLEARGLSLQARRIMQSGEIEVCDWSNYALACRFKAAAMGVPFLPIRSMMGTDTFKHSAAKIIECGAMCCIPGTTADSIMAHLEKDCFLLEPLNPIRKCTPTSVAAHTLYEQPNPYYLYEPEGMADLSQCSYEQYDDRIVRVSGSRFVRF